MWVPFGKMIPIAVLGASLVGSGHCVAMCGGLALSVSKDGLSSAKYHLGRLTGYMSLGALGGLLGSGIAGVGTVGGPVYATLQWIATAVLAVGLIAMGVRLWKGQTPHFSILPARFWKGLGRHGPLTIGLLTAFLPCGWLHIFVLGAIATERASYGALYLALFWAGTLPALTAAPLVARRFLAPFGRRLPRLSAVILVVAGLGSVVIKTLPRDAAHSCHHTAQEMSPETSDPSDPNDPSGESDEAAQD